MLPPVILSLLGKTAEHAWHYAIKHLQLTHESKKLAGFAEVDMWKRRSLKGIGMLRCEYGGGAQV